MKYIPTDKLIAEIEKRQEELSDHNFHSMVDEYDKVLDIIYSLQQEQPEVQLEKEIYNLYDGEYHDTEDVARHFYSLGLNARKEE